MAEDENRNERVENEEEIFDWDTGEETNKLSSHALIGRLWGSKSVNIKATIETMCKLWSTKKEVTGNVIDSPSKTFIFHFNDLGDKSRVLEGQPWHFDSFVWCLNDPNTNGTLWDVPLSHVPLWVRVYDLPLEGRSSDGNCMKIGNQVGIFISRDSSSYPALDRAIRIRVLHDVRTNLKRYVSIRMGGGKIVNYPVKYERLPLFCYECGIIGHGEKDCEDGPYEEGCNAATPPNAMNLLSYNCQGLGNNPTVVSLKKLLNKEDVDMAVLVETKLNKTEMEGVARRLGDYEGISGDSVGRKSGVAINWRRQSMNVNFISSSTHHVDIEISGLFSDEKWRLTDIKDLSNLPWLVVGDFNKILYDHEKKGGAPRSQREMDDFRLAIDDCGLIDIGFTGEKFTWWNKRSEPDDIFERLDRGLASPEWVDTFPAINLTHLKRDRSDHIPLKLCRGGVPKKRRNMQFRFEDMWLSSEKCEEVVREAWGIHPNIMGSMVTLDNLEKCGKALLRWSKTEFGDLSRQLSEAKKRVSFLDSCQPTEANVVERRILSEKIDLLLAQEETYWRQRSRISYLREGDRNTKFFHLKASARRRRNKITKICMENGDWASADTEIEKVVVDYFTDLFSSTNPTDFEEVLHCIPTRPFIAEEIRFALDQMHSLKAPGPDGNDVSNWLINKTHIVMIPKIANAQTMKDFRPISLCNVVMKSMLDDIISPEQSAFVPGRIIADNALIAFEIFHFMKSYHRGDKGYMAFKLDMSKAVMLQLGFDSGWVTKIMRCVTSVSMATLINGGDPLSPYLFIIIARKSMEGIKICRGGPHISHLFFADDTIIFSKANKKNAETVHDVITQYELASGQRINMQKSEIFFSPNTALPDRDDVQGILGAKIVASPDKYLGLPAIIERNKTVAFAPLKERKYLSYAGREIVIKAVAQAISTYHMSLFKLPETFCADLNGAMARFWWGHDDQKRHIYWVAWRKLCKSKGDGGLGFRHLEDFNTSMLAKQLWRLLKHPNTLVARLMKARYYPTTSPLEASVGHHPSYTWRSIVSDFIRDNEWDKVRLLQCVCEAEAMDVMNIPLCQTVEDDELIWHYARDGIYSVKSGHAFILRDRDQCMASSSNNTKDPLWRDMWRLNVQPKVRNFLWRSCSKALPTGINLQQRVKDVDASCCRCNCYAETEVHALLMCPHSQQIWEAAGIQPDEEWGDVNNMTEWFRRVGEMNEYDDVDRLVMLLWAIWTEINKVFHGGDKGIASAIVESTLRYHKNFKNATKDEIEQVERENDVHNQVWRAPPEGVWKINVDAAKFEGIGSGLGVVIRNHVGSVGRAAVKQERCQWSAYIVEAKAAAFGLSMAIQMGVRAMVLESDSLQLIKALKLKKAPANYFGNMVSEILDLGASFESFSVNFIRRCGNEAAHVIAHYTPFDFTTRVWVDMCLDEIANVVLTDSISEFF
ncbi:hypothetical protein RND81_14G158900 [Saponaria officinalis]|uniref:CCHC-type domain-containing protein n=1 Tax=Saponaria officinalis TaxID=3572 RepID=A0AAW1GME1_SAPOF